jgi:hypothetical protein
MFRLICNLKHQVTWQILFCVGGSFLFRHSCSSVEQLSPTVSGKPSVEQLSQLLRLPSVEQLSQLLRLPIVEQLSQLLRLLKAPIGSTVAFPSLNS